MRHQPSQLLNQHPMFQPAALNAAFEDYLKRVKSGQAAKPYKEFDRDLAQYETHLENGRMNEANQIRTRMRDNLAFSPSVKRVNLGGEKGAIFIPQELRVPYYTPERSSNIAGAIEWPAGNAPSNRPQPSGRASGHGASSSNSRNGRC